MSPNGYVIGGNSDLVKLVPSPRGDDHACAVYAQAGSYLDLGDFEDTCISDPGLCESMTWSLWLKIDTSSGFTGYRYYISSGGQTTIARGIAFLYKSDTDMFLFTTRTKQLSSYLGYTKQKIPLDKWFHMVITLDNANLLEYTMLYIDGVFMETDSYEPKSVTFEDECTKLYLGMANTNGHNHRSSELGGSAAYTDLTVFDGRLTLKQIKDLYESGRSLSTGSETN